ncbi:MAG: hypothetical protein JSW43_01250 [Gemmatimonadota bacterium]|nr:MAG: hypothetical protein JSW43_01250 [Gemmatimonadota bacterium]
MRRPKLFRWRAIVPLGLVTGLLALAWWALLDRVVERVVEETGAYLVGARVDLESADVRLREGRVVLRGLEVTDPSAPMSNLFEAAEIVADVRLRPLLERKINVDTVVVRGVRFGTARDESGELEDPSPQSGLIAREVSAWADAVRVPPLSLEGLGRVVDAAAVDADSLRTLVEARALAARADEVRTTWDRALAGLDPRPRIDSAEALVRRLQNTDLRGLNVLGASRLVGDARATISELGTLGEGIDDLSRTGQASLADVRTQLAGLAAARQADYAYARGLLELPSLDAPDISPAIFGEAAIAWVRPVLYWLRLAEEYLPPGIDPRRFRGPKRPRRAGTTVTFPSAASGPRFLLEYGELGLELGGEGLAAGAYSARVTGLTSQPTLYGKPLELVARRAGAAVGPSDVAVRALLDHVSAPVVDSLDVSLGGIQLPSLDLEALGARLVLGEGATQLRLARSGDRLGARWSWRAPQATWVRLRGTASGDEAAGAAQVGTRAWAEELLWRTVSELRDVRIDVELSGALREPSLSVRSNVGQAVASGLRRELGREVERVERETRARVDALVDEQVARARRGVADLETKYVDEIDGAREALAAVRQQLEREVQRLGGRLPGGLRIP